MLTMFVSPAPSSSNGFFWAWSGYMAALVLGILWLARRDRRRQRALQQFAIGLGLKPFAPGLPEGVPIPWRQGDRSRTYILYCFTGSCRGIPAAIFRTRYGIGKFARGRIVLALETNRQGLAPPPASLNLKRSDFDQSGSWTLITLDFPDATPQTLQALLDLYCGPAAEPTLAVGTV